MDLGPHDERLTPEKAARRERARQVKEHRDLSRKMKENYEAILAQLPEDQRARARRMERKNEPKQPLQIVSGIMGHEDPRAQRKAAQDLRKMAAYGQALYGIESGWDPGRQWFDDLLHPTIANQMAMRADLTRVILSVCTDLDRTCRIRREGRFRGGIRRMWEGSAHVPSREKGGLRWIFSIYEPGSALYFPRYQAAFRLRVGDAVCFPAEAYPGVTPLPEGFGARFTLESHPPPEAHQRSILSLAPRTEAA